jgi:hypothetical protein
MRVKVMMVDEGKGKHENEEGEDEREGGDESSQTM